MAGVGEAHPVCLQQKLLKTAILIQFMQPMLA
jgi:hypothetical protein